MQASQLGPRELKILLGQYFPQPRTVGQNTDTDTAYWYQYQSAVSESVTALCFRPVSVATRIFRHVSVSVLANLKLPYICIGIISARFSDTLPCIGIGNIGKN